MIDGLADSRKLAMFLAALGYILLGFIGLVLVVMIFLLFNAGFATLIGVLIYGVIGYIIFKMTRFVHQYSTSVRDFEERGSQGSLLDSQELYTGFYQMDWLYFNIDCCTDDNRVHFRRSFWIGEKYGTYRRRFFRKQALV